MQVTQCTCAVTCICMRVNVPSNVLLHTSTTTVALTLLHVYAQYFTWRRGSLGISCWEDVHTHVEDEGTCDIERERMRIVRILPSRCGCPGWRGAQCVPVEKHCLHLPPLEIDGGSGRGGRGGKGGKGRRREGSGGRESTPKITTMHAHTYQSS